ncbi:MAG TPA: hypothetical protein VFR36_09915 [Sphingomicrobium sp.]|nr:hypothetical protein [Sphingomicrobium sp.]
MELSDDDIATAAGPLDPQQQPQPGDAEILKGRGGFVEPGDMNVGLWYPLQFVVGPTEEALSDEAGGQALVPSQAVYVGPMMRVTLLANRNFDIEAQTSALVRPGADNSASWLWNVSPKRDGTHSLQAQVEVLQLVDGKYVPVESKTRNVSVRVRVGTWQGFMNALQNAASLGDVLTTLFNSWGRTLAALAALIGAIFGVPLAIREGRKRLRGKE